jgi:hypothetical protein
VNATQILDDSHLYVIQTLDDLNELEWDVPGVNGDWTTKDVVAHLATYEHLLLELLQNFDSRNQGETPYITAFKQGQESFNKAQVEQRRYSTAQQVMDEYQDTQTETSSLLAELPASELAKDGTVTLFGRPESLNSTIQGFANHTRTHCDRIRAFRQREHQ